MKKVFSIIINTSEGEYIIPMPEDVVFECSIDKSELKLENIATIHAFPKKHRFNITGTTEQFLLLGKNLEW